MIVLVIILDVTGVLRTYVMPSAGMDGTIRCGDHFAVVLYWLGSPQRDDVIAFRVTATNHPSPDGNQVLVERVVAVAGDRVVIRGGRLFVNGRPFDHDPSGLSFGPHVVE